MLPRQTKGTCKTQNLLHTVQFILSLGSHTESRERSNQHCIYLLISIFLARLLLVRRPHRPPGPPRVRLLAEARLHLQRLPPQGVGARRLRGRGLPGLPRPQDGDRAPPRHRDLLQGSHKHRSRVWRQEIMVTGRNNSPVLSFNRDMLNFDYHQ